MIRLFSGHAKLAILKSLSISSKNAELYFIMSNPNMRDILWFVKREKRDGDVLWLSGFIFGGYKLVITQIFFVVREVCTRGIGNI